MDNPSDALKAADELQKAGTDWFVVKAQIHASRGKGTITETGSHGVVIAKEKEVEDKVKVFGGHLEKVKHRMKEKV